MDTENDLYEFLDSNFDELKNKYSLKELSDLGKELSYYERLFYDYKIYCFSHKTSYQYSFAFTLYEETFLHKLINNNELDYILNNIELILVGGYSLRDYFLEYLKDNLNNMTQNKKDQIYFLITKCVSNNTNTIPDDEVYDLQKVLMDVASKERATLFDIRNLNSGAYSTIYKLNNYQQI